MRNSGTVWTIAKLITPLRAAKGTPQDCVNFSVCENNSKVVGFLRPGHIYMYMYMYNVPCMTAGAIHKLHELS